MTSSSGHGTLAWQRLPVRLAPDPARARRVRTAFGGLWPALPGVDTTTAGTGFRICESDGREQEIVRDQRREMGRHAKCGTSCLRRPRRSWWQPSGCLDRTASATGRLAGPGREAAGRQLLSLIFGPQGGQRLPDVLTELARDPDSRQALAKLEHQASVAFEADPAMASEAAAVIAAFYRQRADAGDVKALVELGDFLYWDEPAAARAAYQEAIDAGHLHALIDLAKVLRNVLNEEEAALAVYEQAAASEDADLSAEAMYEIAFVHVSNRDAAVARAMFERVIGTRHPVWAAAAMVGLAGMLTRRDDPEGAEALYREAIEAGDADWSAHASWLLGDLLESKGDVARAKAAWRRVIGSRDPEWAAPAFASLVEPAAAAGGRRRASRRVPDWCGA